MELARIAENIPSDTPTTSVTIKAPRASSTVAGKNEASSDAIGRCVTKEIPNCPEKIPTIYEKYCTYRGLSKPNSCLIAAFKDSGALNPTSELIGSPGMMCNITKTIVVNTKIVGIVSKILVRR